MHRVRDFNTAAEVTLPWVMTKILIMLQRLARGGVAARAAKRGILNRVMVKGSQTYEGTQGGLKGRLIEGRGRGADKWKALIVQPKVGLLRTKRKSIKLLIRAVSNELCYQKEWNPVVSFLDVNIGKRQGEAKVWCMRRVDVSSTPATDPLVLGS